MYKSNTLYNYCDGLFRKIIFVLWFFEFCFFSHWCSNEMFYRFVTIVRFRPFWGECIGDLIELTFRAERKTVKSDPLTVRMLAA